jgi:LruC domain-containing protein
MLKSIRQLLVVALSVSCVGIVSAFTYTNGVNIWKYLGEAASPTSPGYYLSGSDANGTIVGRPNTAQFTMGTPTELAALINASLPAGQNVAVPTDLISKINQTLPERKDIRTSPVFPSTDEQSNLIMKPGQTSKVWATFVNEGAGFENSVGYFLYDPTSGCVPSFRTQVTEAAVRPGCSVGTSEIVFLPRASMQAPLPQAANGQGATVYLGEIPAGMAMGFVVFANGWKSTGRTLNGSTIAGVNKGQDPNWIYYTLAGLNPEPADSRNLNRHALLLKDGASYNSSTGYQRLVLAFEDYLRTSTNCDHDFNDLVMVVHVEKKESVDNLNTTGGLGSLISSTEADSDSDGVKDSQDEFPNDPLLSSSRYFPGASTWGTLGFEDLWPAKGDYDFNDLLLKYRSREMLNSAGQVKKLQFTYRLDARGGLFHSGFALQLPGIPLSNIASVSVTNPNGVTTVITPTLSASEGYFANSATAPSMGSKGAHPTTDQYNAVLRFFDDAFDWMPDDTSATGDCAKFYNTGDGCAVRPSKTFTAEITFINPIASFPSPPYNPFIYRTDDSQREVHLPNQQPTDWAKARAQNNWLFGTGDDNTNSSGGYTKTYLTTNNLPWAIHIPYDWDHPREAVNIGVTFEGFMNWITSAGSLSKDWFVAPVQVMTFRNNRAFPAAN